MSKFLLLPSINQPKYVLPLDTPSLFTSSISLYTPYLFHRRLAINVMKSLATIRLLRYLTMDHIFDSTKINDIVPCADFAIPLVQDEFKSKNIFCAFYISRKGRYVIQVMNQNAQILGYVKVVIRDIMKNDYNYEHSILLKLAKKQFTSFSIPLIRNYIKTPDIKMLFIQLPEDKLKPSDISFNSLHADVLIDLFKVNMQVVRLNQSQRFNKLYTRISSIKEKQLRQEYERVIHTVMSGIGNTSMPLGFCHGDFKPWNIRVIDNNHLYIFDWEMAYEQWLPLWDYFHFMLQVAILIKRKPVKLLMQRMVVPSPEIITYMQEFCINHKLYLFLFILYILDISSYYYSTGKVYGDREAMAYITSTHDLLVHLLNYLSL